MYGFDTMIVRFQCGQEVFNEFKEYRGFYTLNLARTLFIPFKLLNPYTFKLLPPPLPLRGHNHTLW